jgi:ABC-2 type transport system permease protein
MNLRKIWLIARREYLYNFRRRSYLFTAFVLPLISIGLMAIVFGLLAQTITDTTGFKAIGIVDHAHILADPNGSPTVKLPALFRLVPSEEQAAALLRDKTIDGYYVLPDSYLVTGRIDAYNRSDPVLSQGVHDMLSDTIRLALANRLGDPALAARLQDPLKDMAIYKLGTTQKLEGAALMSAFIVPVIFGLLIFMSIMTTSQFLMSGMAEEKENRMMELFITSARPSEMLWGKLMGLGALGLTQIVVWGVVGLGYASTRGTDAGQLLTSLQITPGFLVMAVAYFILGYFLFGAVMSGIGAIVSAEQEGRQLSSILSLLGVLPFVLATTYLTDPNGAAPKIMSLFPFTAPVGMILRASWATVSASEILLSLAIMVVSVLLMIWLAARVFRLGMLNYGKRLGVRDLIHAMREGRHTIVTASGSEGKST